MLQSTSKKHSGRPQRQLRANVDAAEYKHIALGLIFLKFISDSFLKPSGGAA